MNKRDPGPEVVTRASFPANPGATGPGGRLDETKIGADATLDANRCAAAITAEVNRIRGEAAGADDHDEVLFGAAQGDELPAELAEPGSRRPRLSVALAHIQARTPAARSREALVARYADAERARLETVPGMDHTLAEGPGLEPSAVLTDYGPLARTRTLW